MILKCEKFQLSRFEMTNDLFSHILQFEIEFPNININDSLFYFFPCTRVFRFVQIHCRFICKYNIQRIILFLLFRFDIRMAPKKNTLFLAVVCVEEYNINFVFSKRGSLFLHFSSEKIDWVWFMTNNSHMKEPIQDIIFEPRFSTS